MKIHICLTTIVFLFFLSSDLKYINETNSLEIIYLEYGESTDVSYEPCFCENSIWNENYKSFITYDQVEINAFHNYFKQTKHKKVFSFMGFSNIAILKNNKTIDTIYFDSQFSNFAREKKVSADTEGLNFQDYECYTINRKISKILPRNFIELYEINNVIENK